MSDPIGAAARALSLDPSLAADFVGRLSPAARLQVWLLAERAMHEAGVKGAHLDGTHPLAYLADKRYRCGATRMFPRTGHTLWMNCTLRIDHHGEHAFNDPPPG
jgi:hypothetical protein